MLTTLRTSDTTKFVIILYIADTSRSEDVQRSCADIKKIIKHHMLEGNQNG